MLDIIGVKTRTDLLDLVQPNTDIKKVGAHEYAGPCPKCGGNDRFHVNELKGWFCSYCTGRPGEAGHWHDEIDYVMWRDELDFISAYRKLGGNARLTPEESAALLADRTRREHERRQAEQAEQAEKRRQLSATGSAQIYHHNLNKFDMRHLWHERGLSDMWIDYFQVGFNPGRDFWSDGKTFKAPSLTIPTWKPTLHSVEPSITWECIGLVHRILTPNPPGGKYRPEMAGTGKVLLNCDIYSPEIQGDVLLVEGEIKAMVTWAHVQDLHPTPTPLRALTVVGIAGKSFKREWAAEFAQAGRVYICLDPDATAAAESVAQLLGADRCRIIDLPDKIDDMLNAKTLDAERLEWLLDTARGVK